MQSVLQKQKLKAFQGPRNSCAKWMLESKGSGTMTVTQKKIKKSEDNYQESQENEEDQRKASKLIAYL